MLCDFLKIKVGDNVKSLCLFAICCDVQHVCIYLTRNVEKRDAKV